MTGKKKTILICAVVLIAGLFIGGVAGIYLYPKLKESKKEKEATSSEKLEEVVIEEYNANECINLGKYKDLQVSIAPDEEDIQIEIDNLLEENTKYEQKRGIAQEGDMVYADFEGYVDGKRKETACGSDYVEIGSGDWLDGFEDAIIGLQCGQTREFSVDVPDGTYGDEEIDGHKLDFKLTLQYICGESITPEYNDEFVQSISKYENTKEYTAYLKRKLLKENEEEKLEYSWYEVMEGSKVNKYPKTLLEASRKEVLQGYYDMADLYGVTHDEIFQSWGCQDEKDFVKTQLPDLAKDTAKEVLVAKAIAEKENLNYTKEEYEELLKDEFENNADVYDSKEEYEKSNKNYLEKTVLINMIKEWIGENTEFTK